MRMNLVVAVARNGVIGREGGLPWELPADLKRFRAITLGYPIIMGRVTHASIGRPLPGRRNIVVTTHPAQIHPECETAASLAEALAMVGAVDEVMIIGGRALYAAALPLATRLFLTEVNAEVAGDVMFPEFTLSEWQEVSREEHASDAANSLPFSFVVLERRAVGS
ncbi:MAG: dihydrofolate reductase [Gammaproteobacteria bacterium]|nr:dihydrofolate reductase [Gammaproteobacteria bacterium]